MNTRNVLLTLLVVGLATWWLLSRNNDEKAIRRNLQVLATVASTTGDPARDPAPIARLATIRKLLTEDCTVVPGEAYPSISGRDELVGAIATVVRTTHRLKVTFHDVNVDIAEGRLSAVTVQTVKAVSATSGGEQLLDAREARMVWRKVDGKWRIALIEEVPTLR